MDDFCNGSSKSLNSDQEGDLSLVSCQIYPQHIKRTIGSLLNTKFAYINTKY